MNCFYTVTYKYLESTTFFVQRVGEAIVELISKKQKNFFNQSFLTCIAYSNKIFALFLSRETVRLTCAYHFKELAYPVATSLCQRHAR